MSEHCSEQNGAIGKNVDTCVDDADFRKSKIVQFCTSQNFLFKIVYHMAKIYSTWPRSGINLFKAAK